MRGHDLAAHLDGDFAEEAQRADRTAARERARHRLRKADLAVGALILLLCLAVAVNALVLQAPAADDGSPLPPHRPRAASGTSGAPTAQGAPKPAPAASSAAAPTGGMTNGTLGYLVARTLAVDTPAPSAGASRGSDGGGRPPVALGDASDVTGAVRPPVDVPGASRVLAVQRTLSRLGYGPLKVDGRAGSQTRLAIERFQRDRSLPADGEISDRLVRELSAVSGAQVN